MGFPPPTEKQAKIIWSALTTLSVAISPAESFTAPHR
tara:strand:- start:561 stop:671 length:111 start_codon:yes stop_codon:yes gene_type:complete